MLRRGRHFVESAIDAVADLEFVLKRLEMDVARPVLNRLIENQVDEFDDGRGVGLIRQVRHVVSPEFSTVASVLPKSNSAPSS